MVVTGALLPQNDPPTGASVPTANRAARDGIALGNLIDELQNERVEWDYWLRQIESEKLELRGRKIGVYVEDQALPSDHTSHYEDSRQLKPESRRSVMHVVL
jgi:hypothetical protein